MTDLVILWIYFGFVSCVWSYCTWLAADPLTWVVSWNNVMKCSENNVSCVTSPERRQKRERRRRRRRRPCSLGTVNRCDMVPILVEWFWKEGRRQDWIWREQNNFERETPNRKKMKKNKNQMRCKKALFFATGDKCLEGK